MKLGYSNELFDKANDNQQGSEMRLINNQRRTTDKAHVVAFTYLVTFSINYKFINIIFDFFDSFENWKSFC